ncbi:ribose-phosphate pyrophosphokinase [Tumebacillus sp. ITR2]|uniref:Ribose-phosphate pyrophosphokinase n=1 Tax=Tumebacillus amylolyticus TaxID=2801339 RepID=A0ABS1JA24_9BACL|nr:ribose-phosphate pyrophosphokinase [Tumebacillus amylolyticus]MBL0386884.1 ribose-phosphate pyrophosphokinase [Tumebacillus amylolyticus]
MKRLRDDVKIFSGSSNPALAEEVCRLLGLPLGETTISRFTSGELYVNIKESVRGADVYVIQSFCHPVNENFVELMVMIDALKRSSAGMINVILPYYGYARQEKQDSPREPITAKMVADVLTTVGAERIITMDLHAAAIQGFFNIPVDHMTALDLIADYLRTKDLSNAIVISPDAGRAKTAERLATYLDLPVALMNKRRPKHNEAEITHVIGEVEGKVPIIIEDMIDTGGTIIKVIESLVEHGAVPEVLLCATHAIFSDPAPQRIQHPAIQEVIVTDTFPVQDLNLPKLTVLSAAPLFAEAINRIHNNRSMSMLFAESSYQGCEQGES